MPSTDEQNGDGEMTTYNWFQYFDRDELASEFEAAGFRVEAILGDVAGGDFDPEAAEMAIVART